VSVDPAAARPYARIVAFVYNDGVTPGGGQAGDVVAEIAIRHRGSNLELYLSLFRCLDANCVTGTDVLFDNTTFDPGPLGTERTLFLGWDGAGLFTFKVDGVAKVFNATTDGANPVPIGGPPNFKFKAIGTRVGNLTAGVSNPGGAITAEFDDVKVNGVFYDSFESGILDESKWHSQEVRREIAGGVIEFEQRNFRLNRSNGLNLANPTTVTSLQADVTVDRADPHQASPNARLSGAFYSCLGSAKCGGGTADGDKGDVHAGIEIRHIDGNLRGSFFAVHCLTSGCNGGPEIRTLIFDTTSFGVVE